MRLERARANDGSGFPPVVRWLTQAGVAALKAFPSAYERNAVLLSFVLPSHVRGRVRCGDNAKLSTWNLAASVRDPGAFPGNRGGVSRNRIPQPRHSARPREGSFKKATVQRQ